MWYKTINISDCLKYSQGSLLFSDVCSNIGNDGPPSSPVARKLGAIMFAGFIRILHTLDTSPRSSAVEAIDFVRGSGN